MFFANPADAFAIYQLHDHESTHDHRFLSMSQLQAAGLNVERTNYEVVYAGALHHSSGKATPELLNDIFYRFNMERPEDFYGHSLSVSDIVALKVDGTVSAHYVDRYGFQELHGFLSDQPLKNAEIQEYIQNHLKTREKSAIASADEVLELLTRIARREESEYTIRSEYNPDTEKYEDVVKEVPAKLADVNKALDLLGRRYKLFTDKVEHEGIAQVVFTGGDDIAD